MSDDYSRRPPRRDDRDRERDRRYDEFDDYDDDDRFRESLDRLKRPGRGKSMVEAQVVLWVVGSLFLLGNGCMFLLVPAFVRMAVSKELEQFGPGVAAQVDPATRAVIESRNVLFHRILIGSMAMLGALLVGFGFLVKRFPVPVAILALIVYIGANVAVGVANPLGAAFWIVPKGLALVGLIRAVPAAFAYEKEQAEKQDDRRDDRFDDDFDDR